MITRWAFHDCSEKIKNQARSYWEKKQQRLERLTSVIPKDERRLRMVLYFHEKRVSQYEVRSIMEVPGRSLTVQASDMELSAALDRLIDLLVAAVRKYKEMIKQTYRLQHRKRNTADLESALPLLFEDEKKKRKESFYSILRPRLVFLEKQAERELKLLELEGYLLPDSFSSQDLVNEVAIKAYEKLSSKSQDKNLEPWLHALLYETLETLKLEASNHISLDEELHIAPVEYSTDPGWVNALMGNEERMTLADLLPDQNSTLAWGELDEATKQLHFNHILQTLSSQCRQAFLMKSIEEYSVREISEIQSRSEADVRSDIEQGRESLRAHMDVSGLISKK